MNGGAELSSGAEERLGAWIATQMPEADEVRVEDLDRASLGHSAETLLFTVVVRHGETIRRDAVVVRLCPPEPGLLPPYDLGRQFGILRALEGTSVLAPRALWYEPTGTVLGRELYVMERIDGVVYEQGIPGELRARPDRVRLICEGFIDQLAAIHAVDLQATGLDALGDGHDYLDRELAHWHGEVERVRRAPLPAFDRLHEALRAAQPETTVATLVHGDAKPGNYAFVGDQVVAVFDWEMASVGDPLADVGWAEILWNLGQSITNVPGAPTVEEFVSHWQERTGLEAHHRPWYRAFQSYKMCAIALVAGRLFEDGHTDDTRFAHMTYAISPMVTAALGDLGIVEPVEMGPVLARIERSG